MKKLLELKDHYFERVEIRLPEFPLANETIVVDTFRSEVETFSSKEIKNLSAYKWHIDISSKKKKYQDVFRIAIIIVGIFEVKGHLLNKREQIALLKKEAPNMLYEIIKSNVEKILFHSIVKDFRFPQINFKKLSKTGSVKI